MTNSPSDPGRAEASADQWPIEPRPSLAFRHAALAQRLDMQRHKRFAAEAALRRGARTLPTPKPQSKGKTPVVRR